MSEQPTFDEHGVAHVPAFDLPASVLSSPEARAAQAGRARDRRHPQLAGTRRGVRYGLAGGMCAARAFASLS